MHTFIELFAGCGGLSLGLRSAGFKELLANELSPMPAETFALNLMGVDMRAPEFSQTKPSERPVLWLDSDTDNVIERLSDNPFERPQTDMSEVGDAEDLTSRLIVGDIRRLNQFVENRKSPLIHGEVDLVSGGPPCQSFSLAGRRELGNQRNQLPWEFAKFVNYQRPRMVLLENVEGILRPFKEESKTYYAWFEVCKAFASIGYVTRPLLINARNAGVAQNRPRFIMLAIREDLVDLLSPETAEWFEQGKKLIEAVKNDGADYDKNRWTYCDLTTEEWQKHAIDSVFAPLVAFSDESKQHTIEDAIGDLQDENPDAQSGYVTDLNAELGKYLADPSHPMRNRQHPNSTPRVRARFRIYQIIANAPKSIADEIKNVMRGTTDDLSKDAVETLKEGQLLKYDKPVRKSKKGLIAYLSGLSTKKFSQRALRRGGPAPAALSIPDDVCHYTEARTLSVREMARIQSFPDAFEFRGIATTGGLRRRYQVPQYTQIGNAVPPLLGKALGEVINSILDEIKG
ncbi:DNA cytosine methyltransferase [Bifidobacterium animalis]|uniref:DNA cytosine methyltransferase n=1 Tax=Bifidobacterium animalis TaxID=28025 RepID=UPI0009BA45B8|nr:DNA (cytosine-5-)-methyltransferase [Bifidobacterium animalis]